MPSIEVPLKYSEDYVDGTICQSRVCGQKVQGIDCGGDVSEWLSLVIGHPNLKLVRQINHEIKDKPKQGILKEYFIYIHFIRLTTHFFKDYIIQNYLFRAKLNIYY